MGGERDFRESVEEREKGEDLKERERRWVD